MGCDCYKVCSNSTSCVAYATPCPSQTIDYQKHVGPAPHVGDVITDEILQGMRDVINIEFSVRRNKYFQPSAPTISDFIENHEVNGGSTINNYWTVMANKLDEDGYGTGQVNREKGHWYTGIGYIDYRPTGDIEYTRDKIITGSMIIELYNAINVMVTDCVCYSNKCVCNTVCTCNSECSCYSNY